MIPLLKTALQNREEEKVISFLTDNPQSLGMEDENGSSGLMLIAYSGLEKAFKHAISLKKDFSFHEAIVCGRIEELSTDDSTAMVNTHSKDGFSPLSLAAFFNRNAIAALLLAKGADPDLAAINPTKVTALHSAVAKENYELCAQLIAKGADVNAVQIQQVTPLHSAVHRGNLELAKLLIENGANGSLQMDNGDTPLAIAKREGHTSLEEFLLAVQS